MEKTRKKQKTRTQHLLEVLNTVSMEVFAKLLGLASSEIVMNLIVDGQIVLVERNVKAEFHRCQPKATFSNERHGFHEPIVYRIQVKD